MFCTRPTNEIYFYVRGEREREREREMKTKFMSFRTSQGVNTDDSIEDIDLPQVKAQI